MVEMASIDSLMSPLGRGPASAWGCSNNTWNHDTRIGAARELRECILEKAFAKFVGLG
jgi:hypothetical protein